MKNLIALGFISGLAFLAACSSDGSSSGTGGAAGSGTGATGGGGTGGTGTGGTSATGGAAGSASGGAAGGGGVAGGGGNTCVTCIQTNCGTELAACSSNADCLKIVQCAAACSDQACADACVTANPGGKTAWDAVDACGAAKCATECGGA